MDEDDLILLEERFLAAGRAQGLRDGAQQGHAEGIGTGRSKGLALGRELGYYEGCCEVWLETAAAGSRLARDVERLQGMIGTFAASSPGDEDYLDHLDKIRTLFRKVYANVKAPKPIHEPPSGLSF